MGQRQQIAIESAIAEVFGSANDGAGLCCIVDALNGEGRIVSIQVMPDAMSIQPYPFDDEPVARLQASGALDELDDMTLEIVDWDANGFAILGIAGNEPADVAQLVDQTFTRLLGCDDPNYAVAASTESLEH